MARYGQYLFRFDPWSPLAVIVLAFGAAALLVACRCNGIPLWAAALPLVGAYAVLLIVFRVVRAVQAARRARELLPWCHGNHLTFDPARGIDPGAEFTLSEVMQKGIHRYGDNFCMGKWQDMDICGFDYHYEMGQGRSKIPRSLSVMTVESRRCMTPLTIRPEGLLDKVGEFLGGEDIQFESAEFSRRYHVNGPDRKWAYDVLHLRAIDLLLSSPRYYYIQFDPPSVVIWDGKLWSASEFEQALGIAAGLLDLLPQYVVEDGGGHRPGADVHGTRAVHVACDWRALRVPVGGLLRDMRPPYVQVRR